MTRDKKHPSISSRAPGGYEGGPAEYDRLKKAMALNADEALKSASWGLGGFQREVQHRQLPGFIRLSPNS